MYLSEFNVALIRLIRLSVTGSETIGLETMTE